MNLPNQKTYSQSLDNGFGQLAEQTVVQFLEERVDIEKVEQYPFGKKDVDIKAVHSSGVTYFIDAERRENWFWPQITFPFPTIHVPWRKRRMILNRQPFIYFAVRLDCGRMASIPGSIIINSEILRSKNKYDNTKFYDVPVENLRYWDLEI